MAAAFECGTFIKFELHINADKLIECVGFRSNGCGYMVVIADVVAALIEGKRLTELHSMGTGELVTAVTAELGIFPAEREHCRAAVIDAIKAALADFRRRQIEEFAGEKALICTCFGVSEEVIDAAIADKNVRTVEAVGKLTNAGTGCGSCQMLIQEMIDTPHAGQ